MYEQLIRLPMGLELKKMFQATDLVWVAFIRPIWLDYQNSQRILSGYNSLLHYATK